MSLDPVSRMNGYFFFFAFRVVFGAFVIQGVKPLGQPFHQLFDQVFSLKLSALSRNHVDNVKVCSAQTFIVCSMRCHSRGQCFITPGSAGNLLLVGWECFL